jgi:D-arabinose 1-dehydrogenase-like Zn-dependent alcohol dehydrogenase
MATQKALLVQEIGKPLVIVHDRPTPEPGHGQLQIKVTVAGELHSCRSMTTYMIFSPQPLSLY